MGRPYEGVANGSSSHETASEEERAELAGAALARGDWAVAYAAWHQLACAWPRNAKYRTQLMVARAGELFAAGHARKAREELDRVLRLEPDHPAANALMKQLPQRSAFARLFGR